MDCRVEPGAVSAELLDQVEFEGRRFRSLDLDGQEIAGREFRECSFNGCTLVESSLRECVFIDCAFNHCDLTMARLPGSLFRRTRVEHSRAVGIDWTKATWPKGKPLFPSIDFFECSLSYSTFIGLRLDGIHIVKCIARDVDLTDANLSGADCSDTDFAKSRFHHTNLTEADFTGARNYLISPTTNTLKGTRFSFPEALSLLQALDIVLTE
jgi:uncharacterized protein YjbI with pentapeptide repeats